jgi:hypothetical protein
MEEEDLRYLLVRLEYERLQGVEATRTAVAQALEISRAVIDGMPKVDMVVELVKRRATWTRGLDMRKKDRDVAGKMLRLTGLNESRADEVDGEAGRARYMRVVEQIDGRRVMDEPR